VGRAAAGNPGFLVIYPLLTLCWALYRYNPVVEGFSLAHLSPANFLTVLVNPNVAEALANTLIACGGGTLIAVVIGWVFLDRRAHTRRSRVSSRPPAILPLFAPPLVAGVAWAILGSPKTGLINTMSNGSTSTGAWTFYSLGDWFRIRIYTRHTATCHLSALRNMESSLEEAAEISGASAFATLFSVTFPLIMPAIVSGMLPVIHL